LKKVVRLTESDLTRIIRLVLIESDESKFKRRLYYINGFLRNADEYYRTVDFCTTYSSFERFVKNTIEDMHQFVVDTESESVALDVSNAMSNLGMTKLYKIVMGVYGDNLKQLWYEKTKKC